MKAKNTKTFFPAGQSIADSITKIQINRSNYSDEGWDDEAQCAEEISHSADSMLSRRRTTKLLFKNHTSLSWKFSCGSRRISKSFTLSLIQNSSQDVLVACAEGLNCNGCVRKIPAVPSRTDSSCSKWYKLLFVPFAALEGRVWAAQHCSQGAFSFLCFLIRVCIDGLTSSWMKSGSNIEIMEITCRTVVCSRSPLGASARAVRLPETAY